MCGRFASYNAYPKLARRLGVVVAEDGPPPRYNILPGTWIPGFRQVAHDAPVEQLELWCGYRPKCAKAAKQGGFPFGWSVKNRGGLGHPVIVF